MDSRWTPANEVECVMEWALDSGGRPAYFRALVQAELLLPRVVAGFPWVVTEPASIAVFTSGVEHDRDRRRCGKAVLGGQQFGGPQDEQCLGDVADLEGGDRAKQTAELAFEDPGAP